MITGSARELWIDVLARLQLAVVAARRPETTQRLRRLGLRRTGTFAAHLVREGKLAERTARSTGLRFKPVELSRRVGELACVAPIDWHLDRLLLCYEHLARHAAATTQLSLYAWTLERCRIHAAQLGALEIVLGEAEVCCGPG